MAERSTLDPLDFNEDSTPTEPHRNSQRDEVREDLLARLQSVLEDLFPAGSVRRGKFYVGDVDGNPGDSLEIVLGGDKAGLWTDRATSDGGDIFALVARYAGIDVHNDFPHVLNYVRDLLGHTSPAGNRKPQQVGVIDDLGPPTGKWNYHDRDGTLIAVVYRYDPPGRRKEFRPWDVRLRKHAPPDPRPLYNQPGISHSMEVVLAEGEKSAQALIEYGACGTTAMHGANAPIEKTDWSPLAGKIVHIWPDRDKAGWEYAGRAAQAVLAAGATSCAILNPPDDKQDGWDAADALAEGFDIEGFLLTGSRVPVTARDVAVLDDKLLEGVDWTTDDGLATIFTRRYGLDWKYCALWGKWLVWTENRWNADRSLYVQHLSRSICRSASLKAEPPRLQARLASSSTIAAVERIARSDPTHASTPEQWDVNPWLLNTRGGIVDLHSGNMRAHDRDDLMTKICTAQPGGSCPTWLAFLEVITGGDKELAAYLQRVVGYCLTGTTTEHALFFLYGTGANGKSVFVNVLAHILGDYAANAPMDTFMETRSERHPTDLAGLRGARFVAAIETEVGRRWNESKIKSITGGDVVTARFMRQDFFDYFPQYKLIIVGNHKPTIRNVDEAMKRRLHLIPFTVTIPPEQRDNNLTQKLLQERDGILTWAIKGCRDWKQSGLNPPQSVREATEEYFEAEDAVGRWLDEQCALEPNAKALTIELFTDWKYWADSNGEFPGSQRRFTDALLARHFAKWRDSSGHRGFAGIRLKQPTSLPRAGYFDNDR